VLKNGRTLHAKELGEFLKEMWRLKKLTLDDIVPVHDIEPYLLRRAYLKSEPQILHYFRAYILSDEKNRLILLVYDKFRSDIAKGLAKIWLTGEKDLYRLSAR